MEFDDFKNVQKTIRYEFRNEDLLQQAFIRKSYSQENGGQNNEVLEFVGDKALDLVVIKIMMERFGHITKDKEYKEFKLKNPKSFQTKLNEGQFTDIKKDLVKKRTLANCVDKLGFHTQLIMGKGDIKGNVQEQDSVKEDLFEAILGAVTIDCNWDIQTITNVVMTMIDFDDYFEDINTDSRDYVRKVREWSQEQGYGLPKYEYKWIDRNNAYCCDLWIDDDNIRIQGWGKSEVRARMDAAKNYYQWLLENEYIINEYEDAVGKADYELSLAQINELVQKRMINKPEYEYELDYDENGNSLWYCTIYIDGISKDFTCSGSSKKEAQKECAYTMLCYLMDEDIDE
ncbi:ribonuclease III domain-containing protein [Mycoplasmopsis primatum]|uniref:ribonuclease III domain-containing protein n=1 Tax=Mycoplasmopsis primatum TaxID=55604 RepID=UPI0004964928|nr:ribonuclease III domain-containing protein [Mycoplasmopsis primatum]